jgi:hypothetical protein
MLLKIAVGEDVKLKKGDVAVVQCTWTSRNNKKQDMQKSSLKGIF